MSGFIGARHVRDKVTAFTTQPEKKLIKVILAERK
jgi:hypothetical protein